MGWPIDPRPAKAAVGIRTRVQKLRPDLNPAHFGILGDAAHATRDSDHNPWIHDKRGIGVARAIDVPLAGKANRRFGNRMRRLAKGNRLLGIPPHVAFGAHGYVISDRRIASKNTGWRWIPYSGENPHDTHVHLSFARAEWRYDFAGPWIKIRRRDVR